MTAITRASSPEALPLSSHKRGEWQAGARDGLHHVPCCRGGLNLGLYAAFYLGVNEMATAGSHPEATTGTLFVTTKLM
jgi:hypothetical protein